MHHTNPVALMGAPGSPYTRKMLGALRFRRIPYQVSWQTRIGDNSESSMPTPKVPLLPTFYLPNEQGKIVAVTDSTPLLRRFEQDFVDRSIIPPDPVLNFINWLIEDYADEWLTKAMFHYRWHYAADVKKAGSILPRWGHISAPEADIEFLSQFISERQISRLSYVGSNDVTKPVIESSFRRFLTLFSRCLQAGPFVLGKRPASADFALYGQLTCLALFDPTPSAIISEEFPRVYAWTELLEDLSGLEVTDEDWIDTRNGLPEELVDLLSEIGNLYLPYLRANAAAVHAGQEILETQVDGQVWTQTPFTYQAKCLQWTLEAYQSLDRDTQNRLDQLLVGTNIVEQLRS